jgi:outer membrane protein assembly factor BamB
VWDYKTGDRISASPTLADGVIYVGSHDGHLYAIK